MDGQRRILTYLAMLLLAPSVLPGINVATEARAEVAAKAETVRPEDAALHLGLAYLMAGQKVRARQVLQSVQGSDGAADLARLWIVASQRSP